MVALLGLALLPLTLPVHARTDVRVLPLDAGGTATIESGDIVILTCESSTGETATVELRPFEAENLSEAIEAGIED